MDVRCGVVPDSDASEASQGSETLSRAEGSAAPVRVPGGARHTLCCHEGQDVIILKFTHKIVFVFPPFLPEVSSVPIPHSQWGILFLEGFDRNNEYFYLLQQMMTRGTRIQTHHLEFSSPEADSHGPCSICWGC